MPTNAPVENPGVPSIAPPICVACSRTADLFVRSGQTTLWRALGPVVKATGAVAMLCPECQERGDTTPRYELVDEAPDSPSVPRL